MPIVKPHQRRLSLGGYTKKILQKQQQTRLEQALVYLKLREFNCKPLNALTFAKKRCRNIDATALKGGPSICKKLTPLKPEGTVVNGWLKGEKVKYVGTTGYSKDLKNLESKEKQIISAYNTKQRQEEENLRRTRSQSMLHFNLNNHKKVIEDIANLKEDFQRERENRNLYLTLNGTKLFQTTKQFYKQAEELQQQGLIIKMGVFQPILSDKSIKVEIDQGASKTRRSLNEQEELIINKRNSIAQFQRTFSTTNSPKNKNKKQKLQLFEKRLSNVMTQTAMKLKRIERVEKVETVEKI